MYLKCYSRTSLKKKRSQLRNNKEFFWNVIRDTEKDGLRYGMKKQRSRVTKVPKTEDKTYNLILLKRRQILNPGNY